MSRALDCIGVRVWSMNSGPFLMVRCGSSWVQRSRYAPFILYFRRGIFWKCWFSLVYLAFPQVYYFFVLRFLQFPVANQCKCSIAWCRARLHHIPQKLKFLETYVYPRRRLRCSTVSRSRLICFLMSFWSYPSDLSISPSPPRLQTVNIAFTS